MLRARVEIILAALFAGGAVATAIWPTWIEALTNFEPDGGSGGAEWWLVVLLGALAVASAALARRHHRAATAAAIE